MLALFILAFFVWVGHKGFTELNYNWRWGAIPRYLFRYDPELGFWVPNILMQGFLNTLRLSIWATCLAVIIGTIMGLFRISTHLFRRLIGASYVGLVRNLPPLVLVFIFYYFVSDQILPLLGVDGFIRSRSPGVQKAFSILLAPPRLFVPFLSALVTLAVFEGAYITEIVRAGIQGVEKGQWEAASALGFTRWQQLRYIIFPQALRQILPPLAGQFISTIKDSAIVSVISIQELTFQGMELMAATHLTFEVWITVTGLYLVLTFSCSMLVGKVEARLKGG